MRRTVTVVIGMLAAIAAARGNTQTNKTGGDALFISPMGEPFRGASSQAGVSAWFAGVDANRDGGLSLAEMRADADRFFQVLNTNRDREIDPSELRIYEEQIAPEIRVGVGGLNITSGWAPKRQSGLSSEYSKTGSADPTPERIVVRRGAGLYGLLAIPNPVASTDINLNRGISAEEFARAARERFGLLDANHDGMVRFEELPSLPSRQMRKAR
jgi:hypothetical protein